MHRFTLMDYQHKPYGGVHRKIQQILYYAESRFSIILRNLKKADAKAQDWHQKLLHRELVSGLFFIYCIFMCVSVLLQQLFILSYIGYVTSIGDSVDVPIIVRSLAESIAMLEEHDLPVSVTRDLLMTLDTDLSEQNPLCRQVDRYECAWWTARKPRDLKTADILDRSTVDKCLAMHLRKIQEEDGQLTGHETRTTRPNTPAPSKKSIDCPTCKDYRQLVADILLDMLEIHNFAKASVTSGETQFNVDVRRASTFHQLHEAAHAKEMAGYASGASVSHDGSISLDKSSIAEKAKRELERLQALPPSSHKWTWGESLTEAEVLGGVRPGNRLERERHSGYQVSLREGNLSKSFSPFPSIPRTPSLEMEDLPSRSPLAIPDNTLPDLKFFKKGRHTLYDPLKKDRLTPNSVADSLPSRSTSLDVVDLSTKHLVRHTKIANAERPSSSDNEGPSSRKILKSVTDIADDWLSASDVNVANATIGEMFADWSSASNGKIVRGKGKGKEITPAGAEGDITDHSVFDISDSPDIQKTVDLWSSASEAEDENPPAVCANDNSSIFDIPTSPTRIQETVEMWSSASEADDEILPAEPSFFDTAPSPPMIQETVDLWSSASEAEDENPPANVGASNPILPSPARRAITLLDRNSADVPNSTSATSAPGVFRRFVPEDFSNLQDYMFEDKASDSESEEES